MMSDYLESFEEYHTRYPNFSRELPTPTHVRYSAVIEADEVAVNNYLSDAENDPVTAGLAVTASNVNILCGIPSYPDRPHSPLWDHWVTVEKVKSLVDAPVSLTVKAEFDELWAPDASTGSEYGKVFSKEYGTSEHLIIYNPRILPQVKLEMEEEPLFEAVNEGIPLQWRAALGRDIGENNGQLAFSSKFTGKIVLRTVVL